MRLLRFLSAIFLIFATPAFAGSMSASWTVTQKSGDVRILRGGMQPASVHVQSKLSPGDVIATGAQGRAVLTRGRDYVIVAPASRLQIPKEEQVSGLTRFIQHVGTMFFKVQHTGVPHFSVETPLLAAVVKGTSFSVVVEERRNAVQVTEGIVEVSTPDGSARQLVTGGKTVFVDRDRPGEIQDFASSGLGPSADLDSEAVPVAASGDPSLVTIAGLTNGLVSAAAAPAPVGLNLQLPGMALTLDGAAVVSPDSAAPVLVVGDVAVTTSPTLTAPTLTAPTLTAPTLTAPTLTAPTLTAPTLTAPTLTAPTLTAPTLTAPTLTAPTVSAPIAPVMTAPVTAPITTAPTVTAPVTTPTVTVPTVPAPVPAPVVPVPTVPPPPAI